MTEKTIQAPSVLLMGPPGGGKTFSLATLVKAGVELFCIFTEPHGVDSLLDALKFHHLPVDKVHWHTIAPVPAGWSSLRTMATMIKAMSYSQLSDIKQGIDKPKMNQVEEFLNTLENFHCDRTGKDFGDVTSWSDSRALVIDSLSGVNLMAWLLTVGYKPAAHQGEWGVAMNLEEQLIHKLTSDVQCFFILTAHIDREVDEITGSRKIMAAMLGRKLAPKVGRFFSEVVLVERGVGSGKGAFSWSTAHAEADVKNRALPVSNTLPPDFAPIVEAHRRRVAEARVVEQQQPSTSDVQKPAA